MWAFASGTDLEEGNGAMPPSLADHARHRRHLIAIAAVAVASSLVVLVALLVTDLAARHEAAVGLLGVIAPVLDWAFHNAMAQPWLQKREKERIPVEELDASELGCVDAVSLVALVRRACERIGLRRVPRVYVSRSAHPNASATVRPWAVSFSTALLQLLERDQVEAIIYHELSHLTNASHPWRGPFIVRVALTTLPVLGLTLLLLELGLGGWTTLVTLPALVGAHAVRIWGADYGAKTRELVADQVAAEHVGRLAAINGLLRIATISEMDEELVRLVLAAKLRDGAYPISEVLKTRRQHLPGPTATRAAARRAAARLAQESIVDWRDFPSPPSDLVRANIERALRMWELRHEWQSVDWRDYDFVPDGRLDDDELRHFVRALRASPAAGAALFPDEQARVPEEVRPSSLHPTFRIRVLALADAAA